MSATIQISLLIICKRCCLGGSWRRQPQDGHSCCESSRRPVGHSRRPWPHGRGHHDTEKSEPSSSKREEEWQKEQQCPFQKSPFFPPWLLFVSQPWKWHVWREGGPCGDLATLLVDGQTSWVYCITLVQSLQISCYISCNKLVLSYLSLCLLPQFWI